MHKAKKTPDNYIFFLLHCRLQGLTDSSRDGGPVKVGETEDELWKQFELHRSSAMDEIIDQKSPEGSLTQEQSDGLRGIADV